MGFLGGIGPKESSEFKNRLLFFWRSIHRWAIWNSLLWAISEANIFMIFSGSKIRTRKAPVKSLKEIFVSFICFFVCFFYLKNCTIMLVVVVQSCVSQNPHWLKIGHFSSNLFLKLNIYVSQMVTSRNFAENLLDVRGHL